MAELGEMLHRKLEALLTVTAYRGHVGVLLDVVVIEDGGNPGSPQLLHPWVQKGEAQNEGGLIPPLHHEDPIGCSALELHLDGNDVHGPAVRFGHLLEAQHDVVAELVGGVVLHVFHQNAQLFFPFLPTLVHITQLHGGLQNFLAHFLADVAGVVQALRDSALGDAQF